MGAASAGPEPPLVEAARRALGADAARNSIVRIEVRIENRDY